MQLNLTEALMWQTSMVNIKHNHRPLDKRNQVEAPNNSY